MDAEAKMILLQFETLKIQLDKNKKTYHDLQNELVLLTNVKQFLMDFSENTRELIKNKLESLVNSALKCVFIEKEINFKIQINRSAKIIFYDLVVETDGVITSLFDCKGGGLLDVITMALRISFVRMFSAQLRQTIILDEPFKNLDNERLKMAMEWLLTISKEMGMQFIIVTHEESIIEKSQKVFQFKLVDGETHVIEETPNPAGNIRKTQNSQAIR